MNKNGYLLSELIISFSLSFVILIIIFNTTITLNKKLSVLFIENKATSKQIVLNSKIASDFSTKTVSSIEKTTDDDGYDACLISYTDGTNHYVSYSIDDSWVKYDDERIVISNNLKIKDNITCEINTGVAILKIPIKHSKSTKDYGIELYNLSGSFNY